MACERSGRKQLPTQNEIPLSTSFDKRLLAYVTAASAAGVSMLALSPSAEAKVVYTRVNKHLNYGLTVLDLNNDGTADFGLCSTSWYAAGPRTSSSSCVAGRQARTATRRRPSPFGQDLFIIPPAAESQQNEVWTNASGWAYPVAAGASIGGKAKFSGGREGLAACNESSGNTYCRGPWLNVSHRYLGLKFVINGAVHYGWARLNVKWCCSATLTGYAYETVANKRILAGDIVGPVRHRAGLRRKPDSGQGPEPGRNLVVRTVNTAMKTAEAQPRPSAVPADLGLLALGAAALIVWRRREDSEQ